MYIYIGIDQLILPPFYISFIPINGGGQAWALVFPYIALIMMPVTVHGVARICQRGPKRPSGGGPGGGGYSPRIWVYRYMCRGKVKNGQGLRNELPVERENVGLRNELESF